MTKNTRKMTHGVWSASTLLRPFTNEADARRFAAACLDNPRVTRIVWVKDDSYTAGGYFQELPL